MEQQLYIAHTVLVVHVTQWSRVALHTTQSSCTEMALFFNRCRNCSASPSSPLEMSDRIVGLEILVIQSLIAKGGGRNRIAVPVFIDKTSSECLPTLLENSAWFRLGQDSNNVDEEERFLFHLHGVERHQKPACRSRHTRQPASESTNESDGDLFGQTQRNTTF